jgi:hypothetical protein
MTDWDGSLDEPAQNEEPDVDEGGADSGTDEAGTQSEPALILGKFKDADALASAYKELERQFHERNQPAPIEPDEDEYDFSPSFASEEAQQLAQYAAQGAEYAKQAFEYADTNQGMFGLDATRVRNELFQMWSLQDPIGSQQYLIQSHLAQMREQMQQEFQPLQEQYRAQAIELAVGNAAKNLPGFAERADQVLEHINSIPGLTQAINENPQYRSPEVLEKLLEQALANVVFAEYKNQVNQQSTQTADNAREAPAKAKTTTRSTSAKPASNDVFAELFGEDAFAA